MEQKKLLYDNLLEALRQKVPKKSELVNIVTDTLRIEKESAYRRLRGEIPFTLNEAGSIAAHMGISMDELIYSNNRASSGLAYVALPLHTSHDDYDYSAFEQLVAAFRNIFLQPDSEHGMAVNTLPAVSYLHLHNLSRLLTFKWSHRYGEPGSYMHFKNIQLSERGMKLQEELMRYMHGIQYTVCIADVSLIRNILQDLHYYMNIRLITLEEAELVMNDLRTLLDDLQYIAQYGRFKDTGNKFEVYLSDVHLGSSYNYASGGAINISSLTTFVIQSAVSYQKETYLKIKDWVYYVRRMSTLVTVVGVKERVEFLDKQRRLIDQLYSEHSAELVKA